MRPFSQRCRLFTGDLQTQCPNPRGSSAGDLCLHGSLGTGETFGEFRGFGFPASHQRKEMPHFLLMKASFKGPLAGTT